MKNTENEKDQQDDRMPVTDNEAIKNSLEVDRDKIQDPELTGEDVPGYPTYPAGEDMLNPSSGLERIDIDVENITRAGNISAEGPADVVIPAVNQMEKPMDDSVDDEDDLGIVPGTDADVTAEDLLLLGPRDKDMDTGEDEDLQNRSGFALDDTGEDLDVPGDELDDPMESIGEEDEENNYYSLGGDNKEGLEEDNSAEEV